KSRSPGIDSRISCLGRCVLGGSRCEFDSTLTGQCFPVKRLGDNQLMKDSAIAARGLSQETRVSPTSLIQWKFSFSLRRAREFYHFLRCRILLRMRRFFLPTLRRPFPRRRLAIRSPVPFVQTELELDSLRIAIRKQWCLMRKCLCYRNHEDG